MRSRMASPEYFRTSTCRLVPIAALCALVGCGSGDGFPTTAAGRCKRHSAPFKRTFSRPSANTAIRVRPPPLGCDWMPPIAMRFSLA